MVNTRKLRAKIMENGLNYEKVAEVMNVTACTFGKKIRNATQMTLDEAELLMRLLGIPPSEFLEYFFEGIEG
jgi:transcriptional regulator with XRE-family HTH domain